MHPTIEVELTRIIATPSGPESISRLIAKLHWMGMERDAERLSVVLARMAPWQSRTIGPHDTD